MKKDKDNFEVEVYVLGHSVGGGSIARCAEA